MTVLRNKDERALKTEALREVFTANLKRLADEHALTKSDLARACGVTPGAATGWFKKDYAVRAETALALAEVFGTTVEELFGKSAPQAKSSDAAWLDAFALVRRVNISVQAGISGYDVNQLDESDGDFISFRKDYLERNGLRADKLYAFRVTGSSMEPCIYKGDLVVVNTADIALQNGAVFVFNFEGELVIKRAFRGNTGWMLVSDNTDKTRFRDQEATDRTQVIGRVVLKQSTNI